MNTTLILSIITMVVFILLGSSMFLIKKYCKNKYLSIVFAIITALFALYTVIFSIDYNRVASLRKPIFGYEIPMSVAFPPNVDNPKIRTKSYQGLGYEVEIEMIEDQQIIKAEMYMFGKLLIASVE